MLNIPQHITGISHPLVKDIYLKKFRTKGHKSEDVLIIEALTDDHYDIHEHEGFDPYIAELLIDLQNLETQVKEKVGSFDRVDIRKH